MAQPPRPDRKPAEPASGRARAVSGAPRRRQAPDDFEREFAARGVAAVAGVDEAGRGCWAGPVWAGAAILKPGGDFAGVDDSKILTADARERAFARIRDGLALAWSCGHATAEEIDRLGIVPATRLAMRRAVEGLPLRPAHLLIDALALPEIDLPQTPLIDGDARSVSIAAASIAAKVGRDRWMGEVAEARHPGYGFARHKGYGTAEHRAALAKLGPCPLHRMSFAPLRAFSARAADGGTRGD